MGRTCWVCPCPAAGAEAANREAAGEGGMGERSSEHVRWQLARAAFPPRDALGGACLLWGGAVPDPGDGPRRRGEGRQGEGGGWVWRCAGAGEFARQAPAGRGAGAASFPKHSTRPKKTTSPHPHPKNPMKKFLVVSTNPTCRSRTEGGGLTPGRVHAGSQGCHSPGGGWTVW